MGKVCKDSMVDAFERLGDVKEEARRRPARDPTPLHKGTRSPHPHLYGSPADPPVRPGGLPELPEGAIGPAEPSAYQPDDGGEDPDGPVPPRRTSESSG